MYSFNNDLYYEASDWLRNGRIQNAILTQFRRLKNTEIKSSSGIVRSKIPGLKSLGEYSFLKEVSASGHVVVGSCCSLFNLNVSGNINIGNFCTINGPGAIISDENSVKIGRFVSIAPFCYMQTYNHRIDCLSSFNLHKNIFSKPGCINITREGSNSQDSTSKGGIVIGNDVWIGTKVVTPKHPLR